MGKFTVEHGKSTELKTPSAKPQGLGGGLFRDEDDYRKLPPRYEILMDSSDKVQRLLDTPGSVLGSSEEVILEQLELRHPCAILGATHLYRYEWSVEKTEDEKTYSGRRRRYHTGQHKTVNGWLVMPQPILEFADIAALQDITLKYGAVLIPVDVFETLGSPENVKEAGFTVVDRRFELVQINFNPNYMRLAKWRERVKKYKERVETDFPALAVHAFYKLMAPSDGPEGHPDLTVEKQDQAQHYHVVRLWKTVRHYWGPWWRKDAHHSVSVDNGSSGHGWGRSRHHSRNFESASYTFKSALEACMPYLHAMEKQDSYKEFCKFLRAEARYFKVKIPPAPREPKKPVFKRRKPIRRPKDEITQSRLIADAATGVLRAELGRDGTQHPQGDSPGGAVHREVEAAAE